MISVTERSENLKDEMILDSICKCAWTLAVSIGFTAAALLIGLLPFLAQQYDETYFESDKDYHVVLVLPQVIFWQVDLL